MAAGCSAGGCGTESAATSRPGEFEGRLIQPAKKTTPVPATIKATTPAAISVDGEM
jgi:hypothetical protein